MTAIIGCSGRLFRNIGGYEEGRQIWVEVKTFRDIAADPFAAAKAAGTFYFLFPLGKIWREIPCQRKEKR